MGKLMMVAYYFPPVGGAGVQRALKFAHYLPEYGWIPIILAGEPYSSTVQDPTLVKQIPDQAVVTRIKGLSLIHRLPWRIRSWITKWVLIVDEQISWYRPALIAAQKLIQQYEINALYSTSSPYTDHLIALTIKRNSNLPWVADFRDPWIDNPSRVYPTRLHAKINFRLERTVCLAADRILVTTPNCRSTLLARMPEISKEKVVYLPNGYDPSDFTGLQPAHRTEDVFTIVHNGTFYSQGLTPDTFLDALRICVFSGTIPKEKIRLNLVGSLNKPTRNAIERSGVGDLVAEIGYLPHQESLKHLLSADLLLMVNHTADTGAQIVPAKLYEYFAAGKPILMLTNPGAVTELARQVGLGIVLPPDDANAIATAITSLYQDWNSGEHHMSSNRDRLMKFERRFQTSQLAQILNLL